MTVSINGRIKDVVTFEEYAKLACTKFCVFSLRDGIEHRSPWFSSRERAHKALAIIQSKGYRAIVYMD